MQANHLDLLKALKATEFYPALKALYAEQIEDLQHQLEESDERTFKRIQGALMHSRHVLKLLEDVELLRSLQDNPNADPVTDKE